MKSILFGFSFVSPDGWPGRHACDIAEDEWRPNRGAPKRADHIAREAPRVRPRAARPKKTRDVLSRRLLIRP